jgi:hypothetical protein
MISPKMRATADCRISFIEPRYFESRRTHKVPNDQHPPHNILYGEQLIASVLRRLPQRPDVAAHVVDRRL